MSKKLWSGRFTMSTHPEVERFTASIQYDCELAYEDVLGSLAHAAMLQKCGLLTTNEHNQIAQGLKRLVQDIREGKLAFDVGDEDIHMNIERLLTAQIGEVAGKLHTARSRNDQVALDMHLYVRKKTVKTINRLVELQKCLCHLAQQHKHTIMPGYTHLQRAQPIYFAQHCLAYVAMLQRDVERFQDSWPRANISPLGACALAGTTLPIDRDHVAHVLGLEGRYANTLDAVSDRDFVIEFLASSALVMMHLSRLSEELVLWSSQEFNFIQLNDAFSTGSSIMPQKKNPDVAELGRGKTGRVYGALVALLTVLKGLPLAYNKDMQEDKAALFDTAKTVDDTLHIYTLLMAKMDINEQAMRTATGKGHLNATALADFLVTCGVGFRHAHEMVGKLVALCESKQCSLEDLALPEMQDHCPQINETAFSKLAIDNIAAQCTAVEEVFPLYQQKIEASENWLQEKMEKLHQVYAHFAVPLVY